jgi:D-aminopeptidase
MRARDHGIVIGEGRPGPENAITDVAGVRVGHRGMHPGDLGAEAPVTFPLSMPADPHITGLFEAVVEATEEAIVNALLGATTTEGRDGIVAHALTGDRLAQALAQATR